MYGATAHAGNAKFSWETHRDCRLVSAGPLKCGNSQDNPDTSSRRDEDPREDPASADVVASGSTPSPIAAPEVGKPEPKKAAGVEQSSNFQNPLQALELKRGRPACARAPLSCCSLAEHLSLAVHLGCS